MAQKREVNLEPGNQVQLTSLRTRRKVTCTTSHLVGLGGMAKVYSGELEDGTQVVLKTQRFEGRGADASLEVEIELFKKLFHRNIVHCVGVGVSAKGHLIIGFRRAYQNPLLLMSAAAVDQGMRRDKKARYPSLPLDTAIDLGYELLNALAYLERLGFVHHDVKLANLLIDVAPKERPLEGHEIFGRVVRRNYRGVLIDFGATRSRNYLEAWNKGESEGHLAPQITPFYAPPESVVETRNVRGDLGLTFDASLDVYAAALLLFAFVTGHPPYSHLKDPPDPMDLESVIAVKSAERRGEIKTISRDTIRRVVFEEAKFLNGNRASFDTAFNNFLLQRLDPDPDLRGSAAKMKRDFERLMRIRSARNVEQRSVGSSRVYLPFTQELVTVGTESEHPLLRAARLYGLEARRRSESGRYKLPGRGKVKEWQEEGEQPANIQPAADGQSDKDMELLLEKMDATREDPAAKRRRAPPKPKKRRAPLPKQRKIRTLKQETWGRDTIISEPDANRTGAKENPTEPNKVLARKTSDRMKREELLRRAGRASRRRDRERRTSDSGRADVNIVPTRATTAEGMSEENPLSRKYAPQALSKAPYCLLSPVLDTPLLLSRERQYLIGRDPSVDVRIKSDLVSRRHAQIHWDGKGFILTDLGSLNGTTLNGFRLQGACILQDEDRIGFGGFEFVVRVLAGHEWSVDEGGGTTRIFRGDTEWTRDERAVFAGDLAKLALRDVLEIIDWKRHTGKLSLILDDTPQGEMFFMGGVPIHAKTEGLEGVDAAVELMGLQKGRFSFAHGDPNCPTTLEVKLEELWDRVKQSG